MHSKPRRFGRRSVIAAVVVAVLAVGGVAAWALFQTRAQITGQASVKSPPILLFEQSAPATVANGEVVCGASVDSAGVLTVNLTDGFPGSSCDVSARVRLANPSQPTVKVQGLEYAPAIVSGFLNTSCGTDVSVSTAGPTISMRFKIPTDAVPGTYPATATAGVTGVLVKDYSSGACPPAPAL